MRGRPGRPPRDAASDGQHDGRASPGLARAGTPPDPGAWLHRARGSGPAPIGHAQRPGAGRPGSGHGRGRSRVRCTPTAVCAGELADHGAGSQTSSPSVLPCSLPSHHVDTPHVTSGTRAGEMARALAWRRVVCRGAGCGTVFYLCGSCYRGQAYCGAGCRAPAHRQHRRTANRRHQRSLEGRLDHRDRQRAYRARCRLRRVTDTPSPGRPRSGTIAAPVRHPASRPVCIVCGRVWRDEGDQMQTMSMATENCTLRGDTSRAERTFSR